MTKRRFEVFEYRNVIVRMRLGDSDRQIAAAGLMGRHKAAGLRRMSDAKGWLDNGKPMPDNEQIAALFKVKPAEPNTSQVLPHADKVLKCIDQGISITAIHQMLMREYNFTGGYDAVRRFVRRHRKKTIKPTIILVFRPGEACQVDFGSGPKLTDELSGKKYKTWFFIMTLAFSRHQYVEFVTDQTVETWLGCHRRAFEFFGGVPEKAIIDNAKCAITKACFYDPIVQRAYAECAEGYGFLISPCPVAAPQKKGIVESGVNYVKRNFLPLRRFRNMVDMNQQALEWVMGQAGNRIHGTTHELPLSRFLEIEKSALKALPDVAPETAFWAKAKVHVNCHAMFQKSQYSVPFSLVHQDVWLRATESMVHIYHEEKLVAAHPRLCKPGQHATVRDHLPEEAQAYLMADPQYCLTQAEKVGEKCREFVDTLFADKVLDRLRAVQGILRLKAKYGGKRLEAACNHALTHGAITYKSVKQILERGLDVPLLPLPLLDEIYNGQARYIRQESALCRQQ